jgi:Flp pilus assembly protein TadB
MTGFFARMSPLRAYRDLRAFLVGRGPQELWFLAAAVGITLFLIYAFAKDSHFEKEYRPNIVYVKQWKLDRTDAEIVAQQKIDQVQKDKDMAELKKRQDATRAQFKKLDDQLTRMGI